MLCASVSHVKYVVMVVKIIIFTWENEYIQWFNIYVDFLGFFTNFSKSMKNEDIKLYVVMSINNTRILNGLNHKLGAHKSPKI